MKTGLELTLEGKVLTKSGKLLIIDPCYLKEFDWSPIERFEEMYEKRQYKLREMYEKRQYKLMGMETKVKYSHLLPSKNLDILDTKALRKYFEHLRTNREKLEQQRKKFEEEREKFRKKTFLVSAIFCAS